MNQETTQRMQRDLWILGKARSAGWPRRVIRRICRTLRDRYDGPISRLFAVMEDEP